MKEFDYIVACKWNEGSLCTYTYGSEIQHGTIKSARDFLDYVKFMSKKPNSLNDGDYKIYKIKYKEVQ